MNARKYIGKILPDGHLSLPEDAASEVGNVYEVILLPVEAIDVYSYAQGLAKEKGFARMTEKDVEDAVHESRGVR